jgi:hypothetical protein
VPKTGTAALGLGLLAFAAVGPAGAAEQGKLVRVTPGQSPFAGCTADRFDQQDGVNFPNTEIGPFVDANPAHRQNLVAAWQQDRWSNGGARGNVASYSKNGGRTWTTVVPPGISLCSGGKYARASVPWVSISPSGTAYLMSVAFDPDRLLGFGRNAMLVNRSTDGGRSWGRPVTLIKTDDPQILNDKNSLTADPTNPGFAYAVWDQLQDFTISPPEGSFSSAPPMGGGPVGARERAKELRKKAEAAGRVGPTEQQQPTEVRFKGPTLFTRTTNGGRGWERPRVIFDPGPNAQTFNNVIVVPPSGTVIDFFTEISPNGGTRIGLLRSFDKGATFRGPRYAAAIATVFGIVTPDAQYLVRDASILFDVAVDPKNGNLYLVWQDVRFRGVDEVAFSQSSDNGVTWSTPIRVNQTPANAANPLRQQAFVPSVEVGAGGELVVTYYDFRNDRGEGGELTDHWAVSCSADCTRRASWGEELRLTDRSFDMLDAPIARGHFLGDYMGLVVAGDVAHPVFGLAEGPDRTSLYTRRVKLKGTGKVAALP